MSRIPRSTIGPLLALALAGCASGRSGRATADAGLNAVLWVQSSVEARALSLQAFETARRVLEAALAEPGWTAALEQVAPAQDLPPAVIVDVDETVLDNSVYQARLIEEGTTYDPRTWALWVAERSAGAVPGAVEFTRRADSLGVRVFYVTNREAPLEEDTRANLEHLGFPVHHRPDVVLTRGERPEWDSDKSSRRAHVAERFRILLLIGDDLEDFVEAPADLRARGRVFEQYRERWGRSWIVLPNPQYGSWERSLLAGAPGDADPLAAKRDALDVRRPPPRP